jgi:hypothetical protein
VVGFESFVPLEGYDDIREVDFFGAEVEGGRSCGWGTWVRETMEKIYFLAFGNSFFGFGDGILRAFGEEFLY